MSLVTVSALLPWHRWRTFKEASWLIASHVLDFLWRRLPLFKQA